MVHVVISLVRPWPLVVSLRNESVDVEIFYLPLNGKLRRFVAVPDIDLSYYSGLCIEYVPVF